MLVALLLLNDLSSFQNVSLVVKADQPVHCKLNLEYSESTQTIKSAKTTIQPIVCSLINE